MRRQISVLAVSLLTFAVLGFAPVMTATTMAATLAPTTTCSNGVDDTPGLGLICEVTVVNRITASGGSAQVTVRECHGAAGDPTAACTVTHRNLTAPVRKVTQCNASTNGGGGTLRCKVVITNHFIGVTAAASAVTVNQCVGSGDGIANTCDPFPSTTSGATVTQCNGSANGGTLVQLACTATGTRSAGLPLTINQCNGSTNGGGALVICSVRLVNDFAAAPVGSDTTVTTKSTLGGPVPTPPATDTTEAASDAPNPMDATWPAALIALALGGLAITWRVKRAGATR